MPIRVVVALATVPDSPLTLIAEGYGVAGPLPGMAGTTIGVGFE
jgi:hypothetical protein